MNISGISLLVVAFAAGWGHVALWPPAAEPENATQKGMETGLAHSVSKAPAGVNPSEVPEKSVPLAAMALVGLEGPPDLKAVLASAGADRWVKLALFLQNAGPADFAALLQSQLKDESFSGEEVGMIWQKWVEGDLTSALAWQGGDSGVWAAWARLDPKAAFEAAGENVRRLGEVIRSIGQKDPDWAARLLARFPQVDPATGWEGAVEELSGRDPAAAASLALECGAAWEKQVASWAARDPEAAMTWAKGLPKAALHRKAAEEVIRTLTRSDPSAALKAAAEQPPGRMMSKLITQAVTALTGTDPEAARKAVEAMPPGSIHTAARLTLAGRLAESAPLEAMQVLKGMNWKEYQAWANPRYEWKSDKGGGGSSIWNHDGTLDNSAADRVEDTMEMLSGTHPLELLDLLSKEQGITGAWEDPQHFALWYGLRAEPEKVSGWLRGQPPGMVRDNGIRTIVEFLGTSDNKDHEAAFIWAASAGESKRVELMDSVLTRWREEDFEAAAAAGARQGLKVEPPDPQTSGSLFSE
jgi:hypothetical protein